MGLIIRQLGGHPRWRLTIFFSAIVPPSRLLKPSSMEDPLHFILRVFDIMPKGQTFTLLEGVGADGRVFESSIEELMAAVLMIDLTIGMPCVHVEKLIAHNRVGIAQAVRKESLMNP